MINIAEDDIMQLSYEEKVFRPDIGTLEAR